MPETESSIDEKLDAIVNLVGCAKATNIRSETDKCRNYLERIDMLTSETIYQLNEQC